MDISLHIHGDARLVARVHPPIESGSRWISVFLLDLGVETEQFTIFFHGDHAEKALAIADAINGAFPKPTIVEKEDHAPEPVDAHGDDLPF